MSRVIHALLYSLKYGILIILVYTMMSGTPDFACLTKFNVYMIRGFFGLWILADIFWVLMLFQGLPLLVGFCLRFPPKILSHITNDLLHRKARHKKKIISY